jgi:membrane protease YdiL (CAAX protease family)
MLVFAATVLGILVGLQRRVTGGVLAPIVTHLTWSLSLLFILPPLLTVLP